MDGLRLRTMTPAEFDGFRARLVDDYADQRVRAGDWGADGSRNRALRAMDELLPNGLATEDTLVLTAETDDLDAVGCVWVKLRHSGSSGGDAWVYYIEVRPELRGNGYGRALLDATEREAVRHGATTMGLNVFADNPTARSLYSSAGYEVTSLQMRKAL
ncbi:hypothetical protein GCM10023322_02610 [Rugosimonospora acidiphila]|uniref:N-acetyltransferase domain-containing protein n=1 Tax=Rugosimonospora acidiphila TaxID=556531 RepID=A0ABP9RIW2_9ACTN